MRARRERKERASDFARARKKQANKRREASPDLIFFFFFFLLPLLSSFPPLSTFFLSPRSLHSRKNRSPASVVTRAVVERPAASGGAAPIAFRSPSSSVLAVILGGGAGTRLYPLTKQRAKPAVPIGGAYRLIDVPMSNCINSGEFFFSSSSSSRLKKKRREGKK